jgi:hypothetical protein
MNKSAARVLGAAMACLLSGVCRQPAIQYASFVSDRPRRPASFREIRRADRHPLGSGIFPQRIDTQGASGFVGGGSRTRIPTGVALSGRILEGLDSAVGVLESSKKTLTITIVKAETKFQYSAGFFNVTPAIDEGECTLEASFGIGDKSWTETFHYQLTDPKVGGTSQTAILEKVWDNIAFQVVQNVVEHIKDGAAAG